MYRCKECGESANTLIKGAIGYPSLDSSGQQEEGFHSFGYILTGLEAIGLVPEECQLLREFLLVHVGHQVETPLGTFLNREDSGKQPSHAGMPRWKRPTRARFLGTECEWRLYLVGCPRDSRVFDSRIAHPIRPVQRLKLTTGNLELFSARVVDNLDTSIRGFTPFKRRNFFRILDNYFAKHRNHEPEVFDESEYA